MPSSLPRRVLIVEDDKDSADALLLLLELHGCECQWVADAPEALKAFASMRRQGVSYPEVVLLDLGLPVTDGLTLGRQLLEDPLMSPIVVISARSDSDLRHAAEEMGAFAFLRKPFALDELRALFAKLWGDVAVSA